MVKYFTVSGLFKYSWDQVASGLWQRYPNPNSKHVLTEDTLDRYTEGNKLITRRVLTKVNKVPKWTERFIGGTDGPVLIVEESVVDPVDKTFTTYTRNIGYSKVMCVEEKCVYTVSPDNPSWTVCEKSAFIQCQLNYFIRRPFEAFGHKRFSRNSDKAVQGLDYVLGSLYRPETIKDHPVVMAKKLKESARKAAEMAKSKVTLQQAQ